jgi:hypothetical protein
MLAKLRGYIGVERTVACYNEELVVGVDLVYLDIGERGDDLLLRGKIGALLELEVAYRAGESEVAVDAAKVDEASSGLNACLLGWRVLAQFFTLDWALLTLILRLVVERERLCAALDTQDCTRVTGVGLTVLDAAKKLLKVLRTT